MNFKQNHSRLCDFVQPDLAAQMQTEVSGRVLMVQGFCQNSIKEKRFEEDEAFSREINL